MGEPLRYQELSPVEVVEEEEDMEEEGVAMEVDAVEAATEVEDMVEVLMVVMAAVTIIETMVATEEEEGAMEAVAAAMVAMVAKVIIKAVTGNALYNTMIPPCSCYNVLIY